MKLREARHLAAQCWAASSKNHDSNSTEHECGSLCPRLTSTEISELCDQLILIDDAAVRVMTLTAMFLHNHFTAYPALVARGLIDYRLGAQLVWPSGDTLGWHSVSRAAQTYLAMVIFCESDIDFGKALIEVYNHYSEAENRHQLNNEYYIGLNGDQGWATNPDGSEEFRKLTLEEITQKRVREAEETRQHFQYRLGAVARSSQETSDQIEYKKAQVAGFIEQMVNDLFDDEVTFRDFWNISQKLSIMGRPKQYFYIDQLLVRAVHRYIELHGLPQAITEYHPSSSENFIMGSVGLSTNGRPQMYRRTTPPSWTQRRSLFDSTI